ncbi:MAG: hypothetical protein ISR55_12820 [Bacteroidetes bacterium]|nr:hypothetical protein [Bacteroidota bacterium]
MNKWIKIILALFLIGVIAALLVYKFVYNKPHPDYETEAAVYSLEVEDLYHEYKNNKKSSDEKYLGQIIELSGVISTLEENNGLHVVVFVFEEGMFGAEGIRCTFLENQKDATSLLKIDDEIKLKGYCTGYNDTDIILEKCSFVK